MTGDQRTEALARLRAELIEGGRKMSAACRRASPGQVLVSAPVLSAALRRGQTDRFMRVCPPPSCRCPHPRTLAHASNPSAESDLVAPNPEN